MDRKGSASKKFGSLQAGLQKGLEWVGDFVNALEETNSRH
jgi:hypothetical protein